MNTRAGCCVCSHCRRASSSASATMASQANIARHAENIVDLIVFTPGHQLFAAEAGIATQHDLHFRPGGANLFHDALDLFPAPGRRIDIAGRKRAHSTCSPANTYNGR